MTLNTTENPKSALALRILLFAGPVLLYLGATAFGVSEVHFSTDTWIGLAAGRQILTSDEFPKTDTFSYTFNGQVWYNQNWLTHLIQYWLYAYAAPNAVVYGTWALSASVFLLVMLATYWRSGSWFAALLAAGVVGVGCREFLSARPATTGFFCVAALWAVICALEGQAGRVRRWPIYLILPLLLFWGNAHGSFIFGYGVLGLYVGHWYVQRIIRLPYGRLLTLPLVLLALMTFGAIYSLVPNAAEANPQEIVTLGSMAYYKGKLQLVVGGLVGYVLYWLWIRFSGPKSTLTDRQAAGIVAAVLAAFVLTVALSPFHLKNFTHGEKIASSSLFRQVSEWNPPFARHRDGSYSFSPDFSRDSFPPMKRFWWIFGVTWAIIAVLGVYGLIYRLTIASRSHPAAARRATAPPQLSPRHPLSLFDLTLLIIGVAMTFWARRFAPIYYIFGVPILMTWIVNWLRVLPAPMRGHGRYAVAGLAGVSAWVVIAETWSLSFKNLVDPFRDRPEFNLLERVTRYDTAPHDSILFLRENRLDVNLVCEWTQAGPVMFFAPNAKIFMDGRAQQVYDEDHYRKYAALLVAQNTPPVMRMAILNEFDTDAILLRRIKTIAPLWRAVEQTGEWVPVLSSYFDSLSLRRGGRGFRQLAELLRRGEEWRPNTPAALATRGFVWEALDPPDYQEALRCWRTALEQDASTGQLTLLPMTERLLELNRGEEARRLIRDYHQKWSRPRANLNEAIREELLKKLADCWDLLNRQTSDTLPVDTIESPSENQGKDQD